MRATDEYVLCFDPGGVHVGVAAWTRPEGGVWRCQWALEQSPKVVVERLLDWVRYPLAEAVLPGRVAFETFRLRAGAGALAQTGSTFPEVELIGVIRAATGACGIELIGVEPSARASALARAKALEYRWRAHGHGGHAKDAEAVGIAALKLDAAGIRAASPNPG